MKYAGILLFFILAEMFISCKPALRLKKETSTRHYSTEFEENHLCSKNIFLLENSYFVTEEGCEGNSLVSSGKWKIEKDSLVLEYSADNNGPNTIDLKSFGIDYPHITYSEATWTAKFKDQDSILTDGYRKFRLLK